MTAALLNNIELARRLNGNCRINIASGKAITLELQATNDGFSACAKCSSPCDNWHASGLAGELCKVRLRDGKAEITWSCPQCGVTVSEIYGVLEHIAAVAEIESDPPCHRCRNKN